MPWCPVACVEFCCCFSGDQQKVLIDIFYFIQLQLILLQTYYLIKSQATILLLYLVFTFLMECLLDFNCNILSVRFMAQFQIYNTSPIRDSTVQMMSPSRHNPDFYRRKAERLEQDLFSISDELNKARLRLRRAEDFQIKYELLFKQKTLSQEDLMQKEKQLFELRAKNQQLSLLLQQRRSKNDEDNHDKLNLLKEIEIWKQKALQAEERMKIVTAQEQNKANQKMQKELARIKRNFNQAQDQYKFRIARLTKQVQEKSTTDNTVYEKHQRIKIQKENQIVRLEKVVQRNREQFLTMVQQKNKEIDQIKNKFQQIFNQEISHLRTNMGNQDQKFNAQLESLRKLMQIKNAEIQNLQNELKINLNEYSKEREQLNYEIKLLKEKIYERERENEKELYNMKERLTSLHAIDIQAMKTHYQDLIEGLRDQRKELETLLAQKELKVEFEMKEFERGKEELKGIIRDRQRTIDQLKSHQITHTETNSNQINNIQQSLAKLANEKQALNSEYQANIAFLNQQLSKLTTSNQLKNNEIRELHEYIALLKKEHFQSLKDLQIKWKNQRKEREAERERERDLREKVEQEYREKEKQWRNKERQLQRQFQKERRQKNKWMLNNQKLQKQIERLFKENSQLQEQLKSYMGKNQKTTIVSSDAKRELSNQLQKQRIDLETKKRMEIDQVKKQYELQLTRIIHQNQKLQNQLTAKKIDYQNLQDQFKKVSSQYKNIQKINKQKLSDYHKKMSTLNSQILLTQNLYQSFIDAKSRVVKKQ